MSIPYQITIDFAVAFLTLSWKIVALKSLERGDITLSTTTQAIFVVAAAATYSSVCFYSPCTLLIRNAKPAVKYEDSVTSFLLGYACHAA
jgi:hypothetical protein